MIGPNGAGKTTLLSILAGSHQARRAARSGCRGGAVGWVPQQAALYRRLTVEENLLLFARLEGHEDPHASVEEMLELSGLGERRGEAVARLSGGNQQRINIAIGLLSRPVALLLDEPSVGLDPRQRARLWEFVGDLAGRGTTVIFSTHDIQEAERYGRRLLVLADGESLFDGSPDGAARGGAQRGARGGRAATSRPPSSPSSTTGGTEACAGCCSRTCRSCAARRCRRVLLVAYPVLIAILVGFAISPDSEQAAGRLPQRSAGRHPGHGRRARSCPRSGSATGSASRSSASRSRAARKRSRRSRSGDALAALILPADLVDEINSLSTLAPGTPKVEVLVNEENPLKAQAVDDRITALLAQANLVIAKRVATEGGKYLNLLIDGGEFEVLGTSIEILGLKTTGAILEALRPAVPPGAQRDSLDRVIRFSSLARENLGVAQPLIDRLAQPIEVEKEVVDGNSPPLDIFAIAVAATLTLAFVTVLLVAGSLALEREENAFPRLTRSLVSPSALLGEKVVLGVAVGLVVTLLMLAGLQFFVPLQWEPLRALAGGDRRPAARRSGRPGRRSGRRRARCGPSRCSPSWSPCRSPSSRWSRRAPSARSVYDAIEVVVAVFPFKPALDAMTAALDSAGGSIGGPLLHLAILTVAYALLARFALRRFSAV